MSYVFNPSKVYDSELFPGVKITLRKMTEKRRVALQTALSEPQSHYRATLQRIGELDELDQMNKSSKNLPEILQLKMNLQTLLTNELNPAKLRWAVAGISGLKLSDEDATLDNIMDWPSDLIEEILNVIEDGTALSEIHVKNSSSVTTSGAAVVGPTNDTTAAPASETDSSKQGTALSTSPS